MKARCECGRRAIFRIASYKPGNKNLHSDKNHDLCRRCYTATYNAVRAADAKRAPSIQKMRLAIVGGMK